MRIAIVGTGSVGGTLGHGWRERGHQVTFGSRDTTSDKVRALLASSPGATAASVADAVAASDVVVLVTPWDAAEAALRAAGDLSGKILVDATNPIGPGLTHAAQPSGAELVAGWAHGARVVKAFNSIGFNVMANPRFGERGADAFICGDNSEAKEMVAGLARDLGFEVVDCGPLSKAILLESLALLWISLAYQGLGREIAFALMRR